MCATGEGLPKRDAVLDTGTVIKRTYCTIAVLDTLACPAGDILDVLVIPEGIVCLIGIEDA